MTEDNSANAAAWRLDRAARGSEEHLESTMAWIADELSKLPMATNYPSLTKRCLMVIRKWYGKFSKSVWIRAFRDKRLIKELNEVAPVIATVEDFLRRKAEEWRQAQQRRQDTISTPESDDAMPKYDDQYTIVDLCSGFGYMSMFFSELLCVDSSLDIEQGDSETPKDQQTRDFGINVPAEVKNSEKCSSTSGSEKGEGGEEEDSGEKCTHKSSKRTVSILKEIFLVDKMWPMKNKDAKTGRDTSVNDDVHINRDHIDECEWSVPLTTLKMDIKQARNLKDLKKHIFDDARQRGDSGPPKKAKIILLGVHLCGSLSLRAIQIINENPSTIALACVKPCCLPSKKQLASQTYYTLGNHRFETEQVYFPQRYDEAGAPIESVADWEEGDTVAEKTTETTPETSTTATDLDTVTTSTTSITTSTTSTNKSINNNNNDDDEVNDLADEESDEENFDDASPKESRTGDGAALPAVTKPKRISHRRRKFNAWCQHLYSCLDCAGATIATNGIEIGDLEIVCPEVERQAVEQPEQASSRKCGVGNRRTVQDEKIFTTQTIVPDGFQNKLIFVERDLHKYAREADSGGKPVAVQGQIVFRGKELKQKELKQKKKSRSLLKAPVLGA